MNTTQDVVEEMIRATHGADKPELMMMSLGQAVIMGLMTAEQRASADPDDYVIVVNNKAWLSSEYPGFTATGNDGAP